MFCWARKQFRQSLASLALIVRVGPRANGWPNARQIGRTPLFRDCEKDSRRGETCGQTCGETSRSDECSVKKECNKTELYSSATPPCESDTQSVCNDDPCSVCPPPPTPPCPPIKVSRQPSTMIFQPPIDSKVARLWKALTLFLALPVLVISAVFVLKRVEKHENQPRPPFEDLPYLHRITKRFPWGDGKHSFFHNPERNPLPPDGYEVPDPYLSKQNKKE